jgi:hypothetical protein
MPPGSPRRGGANFDRAWVFCRYAELFTHVVDGLLSVFEPVHGEEVDAVVGRGGPRAAPQGVGEAHRDAFVGQVTSVVLEEAHTRCRVPRLEETDDLHSKENARGSSLARAMNPNTSISDSTVEP